jgi:hypothetical protein
MLAQALPLVGDSVRRDGDRPDSDASPIGDGVPSVLLLMSKGNDGLGREQSPFT